MSDRIVKAARSASKIVQGMNEAAMMAKIDALQAEVEALKGLLEDALINHLGIMKFSALKKNGWVWPNDAPETVSILSEKIRAALKGAPHE